MPAQKRKVLMLLPQPDPYNTGPRFPLTLLAVASLIDRKRFDVRVYSATQKYDYMERIMRNLDNAVCLAVSSLTGSQIRSAIEAVKEVKKVNPKLPIVWGGWHASILPEQTLQSKYADVVVVGQGEKTMPELVEALALKKSLAGIKGIYFKDKNGKIVKNRPRPFEDINNFPRMSFDLINIDDFVLERNGIRSISIMTSQGCPFKCEFCADPLVYNRRWSGLKPKRVVDEMQFLKEKYNIGNFYIIDENFFVDMNRVKEMCKEIIKRKLNITWGRVNGRTKQLADMDEENWALVKQSGCTDLLVGAESGLQEGLDLTNKMTSLEDTTRLIALARKHGVEITPSLMVGLPFASYTKAKTAKARKAIAERELNAILDLLDKCYPTKDYFEILLFVYTPYPGNPMFEKSIKLGFKPPNKLQEWVYFDIVQQNLPWLPDSIYSKTKQLLDFVFPYACNSYMQRHSPYFKPVHILFHWTALFRWKHRFFSFPLEHKTILLFRWLRRKALLGL